MKRNIIITCALAGILLLLLAVIPASAVDKIEIRGEVVDLGNDSFNVPSGSTTSGFGTANWTAYNFAAFWYDLDEGQQGETLYTTETVANLRNRTIGEDDLIYNTTKQIIQYEVNDSKGLNVEKGLDVDGTKITGAVGGRLLCQDGLAW